jgi:ankyrin repeat protein
MDVFDLLAQGRLDELTHALDTDPALAAKRNASGASLLAWAFYVGRPEAAELIRPRLADLDPHDAIILGDADRVREALTAGWDANALSADGFGALALSAFFGRDEIFDLLLPVTGDVNLAAQNGQKVAAIHAATARRNTAMVEKLLRAGAEADQVQADGFTPLHVAAQHGDGAIAALLVLFGANPRKHNVQGNDAITHARMGGHDWLAERLAAVE